MISKGNIKVLALWRNTSRTISDGGVEISHDDPVFIRTEATFG
jgi:hypothetical protein